ncbi:putative bifunctional inhibitor/plant lipid transfer protein/seed storage helical [Helianthus annuus]|uniref:Bifunctional inhibitor/plant lipid transfer protein/seed storage helical n=2 Tax=Helianthus annuus TaxID=4232 RepID=A0A9K3HNH6_HELAN|nr:putative bifunctional inhibitor/plant lipid transfer protein/seed storage helical [Helianthus annuus]KAJ0508865.1 putative bifunctional inhibitor/plant lipid transfer protein/seed storage helical [Helianthus annuus]
MARFSLVVFAALLVAMAAVAESSRETIFTTTFNDKPRGTSGTYETYSDCYQKAIDEQRSLFHCFRYLLFFTEGTQDQKDKQVCCTELKSLGDKCICPDLNIMMSQPYWRNLGSWESTRSEASNLPTHCNVMPEPCEMEIHMTL